MGRRADRYRDELERLARRAVAGDLAAARKIVAILEARARGDAPRRTGRRATSLPSLIARFQPQRWNERDYAVDDGPVQELDVTFALLRLPNAEDVRDVRDHDDTSDYLVPALAWPGGEDGTGYLTVEDELEEWLEGHGLDRSSLTQAQWEDLRDSYGVRECGACGELHEVSAECEDGE